MHKLHINLAILHLRCSFLLCVWLVALPPGMKLILRYSFFLTLSYQIYLQYISSSILAKIINHVKFEHKTKKQNDIYLEFQIVVQLVQQHPDSLVNQLFSSSLLLPGLYSFIILLFTKLVHATAQFGSSFHFIWVLHSSELMYPFYALTLLQLSFVFCFGFLCYP